MLSNFLIPGTHEERFFDGTGNHELLMCDYIMAGACGNRTHKTAT